MAFENYYVASDLNTLGTNMSQDRATAARLQAAQMEQQRLAYAAFMQQLQQRQAQQQQAQQFQQELALRQSGQTQENAYRNAMLGLQKQQQEFAQTGYTPEQEWMRQFREKEIESKERIAQYGQNQIGQQALAAMINQQGLTSRYGQESQEIREAEEAAVKAKQSQYNAILDQIDIEAKEVERKKSWGWNDPQSRKIEADQHRSTKFAELMQALQLDRRPGDIALNPQTRRFESALPVRRPSQAGGVNPLTFGQLGTNGATQLDPRQAALIQALQGQAQPQIQSNNAPPVTAISRPIRVRASDGRIWIISNQQQLEAIRARDPGAVVVQ